LLKGVWTHISRHKIGLVGLFLALSGAAYAGATGATPARGATGAEPGLEVGPGIYLSAASPTGGNRHVAAPTRSTAKRKIINGSATTIRRWPWQVSIGYLPLDPHNARKNHNCGGSLVAPTIVVTAAHCMTLGPNRNFRPPGEFNVVSGRTRLSSDRGKVHDLANYFWFTDRDGTPLWNPDTGAWDVVFLQLASKARQTPIKVAGPDEASVWIPGQRAFVTGWGLTADHADQFPDRLRQGRLEMVSDPECESVYGPLLVSSVMVCAGASRTGADACGGDSGGPLVVPIAGGGYRLVGDVSFGPDCTSPPSGVPGVYGRLAADPMRTALQRGIEDVAGANVIGSGAERPSRFEFGPLIRNQGSGTARLVVRVPGRGRLALHRTGRVQRAVVYTTHAGPVRIPVRPRGDARRKLSRTGRARLRARVTYRPDDESRSKALSLLLLKRG
jgi:hypothetical protein